MITTFLIVSPCSFSLVPLAVSPLDMLAAAVLLLDVADTIDRCEREKDALDVGVACAKKEAEKDPIVPKRKQVKAHRWDDLKGEKRRYRSERAQRKLVCA